MRVNIAKDAQHIFFFKLGNVRAKSNSKCILQSSQETKGNRVKEMVFEQIMAENFSKLIQHVTLERKSLLNVNTN